MAHRAIRLNDGRVLILGGRGQDGTPVAETEIYDPKSRAFRLTATFPDPSYFPGPAILQKDNSVIVLGGERPGQVPVPYVWRFKEERFMPEGPLQTPRSNFQASMAGDRIIVSGGLNPKCEIQYNCPIEFWPPKTDDPKTLRLKAGYFHTSTTVSVDGRDTIFFRGGYLQPNYAQILVGSSLEVIKDDREGKDAHNATLIGASRVLITNGTWCDSEGGGSCSPQDRRDANPPKEFFEKLLRLSLLSLRAKSAL